MKKKVVSFILTFLFALTVAFGAAVPTKSVQPINVHFIDTGNSDSILISDNGKYMLIDGAENDDETGIVDYLNNLKIKKLDYIVLTHPDADHVGGLDAVVENFEVGNIFVSNGSTDTKTYKDFLQAAIDKNLKPSIPLPDKTFTLGNGKFKFYNMKSTAKDVNDRSLVTLYTNGSNKFLFTGDAGTDVEKILPLKEIGKIDVLKVGHHGSSTSSGKAFIQDIKPMYGVICVAKDNKYGHPHKETTNVLSANKVTVYRTDLNGDVVVNSDGKKITVSTSKKSNVMSTITAPSTEVKPVATTPIATTDTKNAIIYITKTGTKYHKDGCKSLSKSKILCTIEEAKAKGLTPCSVCKP